ncbi:MAG: HNH endonuclease [Nitrospirae bacterium YQR-1]
MQLLKNLITNKDFFRLLGFVPITFAFALLQRIVREYSNYRKSLTDDEKLLLAKYKQLTKQALKDANYRCERCLSPKKIEVHYIENSDKSEDFTIKNFAVLCKKCHEIAHEEGNENKKENIKPPYGKTEGYLDNKEVLTPWQDHRELQVKPAPKMTYNEYLESPEWKQLSKEAKKKADYKCERCSSAMNLEAHHTRYSNNWPNDNIENIVVLCDNCHEFIHKKDNKDKKDV